MKTIVKSPSPVGTRHSKSQKAPSLTVILRPCEEGGFTAICPEIPGAISEGDTEKEAVENLADAMRCVLEVTNEMMIERLFAYAAHSVGQSGEFKPKVKLCEAL